MNASRIDAFKEAIRERVLVTKDDARIISRQPDGNAMLSRWLFDFRAVMLDPRWLDSYAEIFWERYGDRLPFQVGGMETAAIPLVAAIVMKGVARGTPVNGFYLRKSRKREGLMKQIEGTLSEHPVIIVDDLVNSGGSIRKQLEVIKDTGRRVTDAFVIVAFRNSDAYAALTAEGLALSHLFDVRDFGLPLERMRPKDEPRQLFTTIWKFPGDGSFEHVVQKSAPVVSDGLVLFGTDSGTFYALDQKDGEIAWSFETGRHPPGKGIFSCALVHEGVAYFGAYDGNVYALDARNGEQRWTYAEADWVGSSPAIAPGHGLLYIGLEFGLFRRRGGIAAIDMRTGTRRWIAYHPSLTHGSPVYIREKDLVVIGSNNGVTYAYDAATGTERWAHQSGADIKTAPAYHAAADIVLTPSSDGTLYALRARDGTIAWAHQTGGIYSTPRVLDGAIYLASLDKCLYRLDEYGRIVWAHETRGRIFASPILADGSIWIGSNDGRVYEIDPMHGSTRGFHQFSERIVNAICHDPRTKRFFVPTVANELHCCERAILST